MNNDKIAIAKIQDKIDQCSYGYYATNTGFLDSHNQALALSLTRSNKDVKPFFLGGYEDAERRILVLQPADFDGEMFCESDLLSVLRVEVPRGSKPLSHRNFLGSILGLGIDRSLVGDILVRDSSSKDFPPGADIIIMKEISDFLLTEYRSVGRSEFKPEIIDLDRLIVPKANCQIISDTVSSLRLDNIVASAFKLSRSSSLSAIKSGIVSVNHIEQQKPDARVQEGDIIVLRGKGKVILNEVGGESKKGRIRIKIKKFI